MPTTVGSRVAKYENPFYMPLYLRESFGII